MDKNKLDSKFDPLILKYNDFKENKTNQVTIEPRDGSTL